MSVVVAKVFKDRIEMAADSIVVKGWSKMNGADKKFAKMMKHNDMIIGGCGMAEDMSLFFHYMRTHTIDCVDERSVLDFVIEFKRWKGDLTGNNTISNSVFLIAYQGKCFCIEDMLVFEIDDYYAIGAGEDYAMGALCMGASPREAVKVACDLCVMVSEPIIQEWIPKD